MKKRYVILLIVPVFFSAMKMATLIQRNEAMHMCQVGKGIWNNKVNLCLAGPGHPIHECEKSGGYWDIKMDHCSGFSDGPEQ